MTAQSLSKLTVFIALTLGASTPVFADLTTCRVQQLQAVLASPQVADLAANGDRISNIETVHEIADMSGGGTETMNRWGDTCVRVTTAQKMMPERTLVFILSCESPTETGTLRAAKEVRAEDQTALEIAVAKACGI